MRLKKHITLLVSVLIFTSCRNSTVPDRPKETRNVIDKSYQNIPGTRLFIIPPPGFVMSKIFPVAENKMGALIEAGDVLNTSFFTHESQFSKPEFERKGDVISFREFTINGFAARMALLNSFRHERYYTLILGDSTCYASIIGRIPKNDAQAEKQIKKALESIYYDKTFTVKPFAIFPFRVNDSNSTFKFREYSASSFIYTVGGKKIDPDNYYPNFTICALPANSSLRETADIFAKRFENRQSKNVSTIPTNGFPAFKREVYPLSGEKKMLYQHVVLIGEIIVIMQGIAVDNFDESLKEFEELSNTIQAI